MILKMEHTKLLTKLKLDVWVVVNAIITVDDYNVVFPCYIIK